MTAAELFRHNLERLLAASRSLPLTIALEAWPIPAGLDAKAAYNACAVSRRKLQRIRKRSGLLAFADLDALAHALRCDVSEFWRAPSQPRTRP